MKMNRHTLCMAAAALLAAFALTGCSLLKVAVATGDPLSKEEMNIRTMTRGFYYDMASEVSRTRSCRESRQAHHKQPNSGFRMGPLPPDRDSADMVRPMRTR